MPGPLLGSSADASTAFTDHFADDGNRMRDLAGPLALLVAAAGLLLTVPVTTAIGELTDDPGIAPNVQAGIAQAGTTVLLVAALCLALTTVLVARLGRQSCAVPRWIAARAWATEATLLLGVSVGLLMPFGAWAIALGLTRRGETR